MGRITDYDKLDKLADNDAFVVETSEGTHHVTKKELDAEYLLNAGKNITISKNTINISTSESVSENDDAPVKSKAVFKALAQKQNTLIPGEGILINEDTISLCTVAKYGVCRDIPSHDPTLARVGDAVGLIAEIGVNDRIVRNDFDHIYPWSEMKRCTLSDDGTVTSYFGDPNYTEDGSLGQVMVEIPKFYIAHYFDESATKEYWYISKEKIDSRYMLPKAFINEDGVELDCIYVGAFLATYDSDNKAESKSGIAYYASKRYLDAQELTIKRGTNWHQFDVFEYEIIKSLFIVEFATLDAQSIMKGNTKNYPKINCYSSEDAFNSTSPESIRNYTDYFIMEEKAFEVGQEILFKTDDLNSVTGDLDSIYDGVAEICRKVIDIEEDEVEGAQSPLYYLFFDGQEVMVNGIVEVMVDIGRNGKTNYIKASSGEINGTEEFGKPLRYRYIEYLYGEHFTWIDGVLCSNNKYYVCENPNEYTSEITENYQELSYSIPNTSGYISKLGKDDEYPFITLPTESNGSSNTDFCDLYSKPRRETLITPLSFGGSSTLSGGLFNINSAIEVSGDIARYSRLSYRQYS